MRFTFPALALLLCLPAAVAADPAAPAPKAAALHLTFEFVEVPLADWGAWISENPLRVDASPLYQTVGEWKKAGKASLIEIVSVQGRSGQRCKAESITEITYPTDFQPAKIPATLSQIHNLVESPSTTIHPEGFETRNVGVTVEVDPVISGDGKTVDLNLSPEIVRELGTDAWPNDEVEARHRAETPRFYTAKITSQIVAEPGKPTLVGTVRLPGANEGAPGQTVVLVFAKVDLG